MTKTEYINAETNIRAVVVEVNGLFDVRAYDDDANETIEIRKGFKTAEAAAACAAKFAA
jgi:hypothetical protein